MSWGCKPPHSVSYMHREWYEVFEPLHFTWCGWAFGCTFTLLHLCRVGAKFGNLRVKESPSASNIMVSFLEAINQPILLLTSIMDDMKCFSTFLWCGWAFGCTFTLLKLCRSGPNFGKLKVRWSPNNIMVLCFEAIKLPQSAFYLHIGCIECVWAPSYVVEGHLGAPLHYTPVQEIFELGG